MSAAKFINGWLVECEAGTGKGAMPSLHLESQVVAGGGAGAGSVPEDAGEVPTDQFLDWEIMLTLKRISVKKGKVIPREG